MSGGGEGRLGGQPAKRVDLVGTRLSVAPLPCTCLVTCAESARGEAFVPSLASFLSDEYSSTFFPCRVRMLTSRGAGY